MITKRVNLIAGSILGGVLLLGTAGLVLAQDPRSTPTPASMSATCGQGMMGGQGMMDGQGKMGGTDLMQTMHEAHHSSR